MIPILLNENIESTKHFEWPGKSKSDITCAKFVSFAYEIVRCGFGCYFFMEEPCNAGITQL